MPRTSSTIVSRFETTSTGFIPAARSSSDVTIWSGTGETASDVTSYVPPASVSVTPAEAARLADLPVTAPESGYTFTKLIAGKVPSLSFETPEDTFDYTLHVGGEGAFAPDNRLPSGLVYQIQLFVSNSNVTVRQLKGVSPVYVHAQRSGKKLYAAGLFRTYADAEQALSAVRRSFPSAFVIAFDGGAPIGLSKARKKESSVKVITEEVRIVK